MKPVYFIEISNAIPAPSPIKKSIFPITTAKWFEGYCLIGWFVLVKVGSLMLKNMGPNPLAIP